MKEYDPTILISYPRSGRHYFAILIELYTGVPLISEDTYLSNEIIRPKTIPDHHGLCLNGKVNIDYYIEKLKDNKIIYLQRKDYLSVIFSYMYYQSIDLTREDVVERFLNEYEEHLTKWNKVFEGELLNITYENLFKSNSEFKKVCDFLRIEYNEQEYEDCKKFLTKEKIKELCDKYNYQNVMKLINDKDYENKRKWFKDFYKEKTLKLLKDDSYIKTHLLTENNVINIIPSIKQNEMFEVWSTFNKVYDYRYNYKLNENSVVFDLGGYQGEWSKNISERYNCNIHLFEIYDEYYKKIKELFKNNTKIKVNNFGLSSSNKRVSIKVDGNKTRAYYEYSNIEKLNKNGKLVDFLEYISDNKIKYIDLIKINIEGGEYELLEYLLKTNYIQNNVNNIQVQFHHNVDNHLFRMIAIQNELRKTHYQTYCFPTIWENWVCK